MYFKHKYITQPTITPADRIVNAYHELTRAIEGFPNSKGGANMEALQCLNEALSPGNSRIVRNEPRQPIQIIPRQTTQQQPAPRVQFSKAPPQLTWYDPDPRVPLQTTRMERLSQLIVASPEEPIVASPEPEPFAALPDPIPILRPLKPTIRPAEPITDSIASWTRSRQKIVTQSEES